MPKWFRVVYQDHAVHQDIYGRAACHPNVKPRRAISQRWDASKEDAVPAELAADGVTLCPSCADWDDELTANCAADASWWRREVPTGPVDLPDAAGLRPCRQLSIRDQPPQALR